MISYIFDKGCDSSDNADAVYSTLIEAVRLGQVKAVNLTGVQVMLGCGEENAVAALNRLLKDKYFERNERDSFSAVAGRLPATRPVHPAAELFPGMTEDEYQALKTDIQTNGQREPIVSYLGQLLDGRHRARACEELGIKPDVAVYVGTDPFGYVISRNLHRRHLTSSQRAILAAELEPMLAKEAKERQRSQGARGNEGGRGKKKPAKTLPQKVAEGNGEARDQAAKLTGTNRQYVSDAKAIKEAAPELAEQVRAGTKTLPQAKAEHAAKQNVADNGSAAPKPTPSRGKRVPPPTREEMVNVVTYWNQRAFEWTEEIKEYKPHLGRIAEEMAAAKEWHQSVKDLIAELQSLP